MHLRDLGLPDLIAVLVVAALLIWGGKLRNVFRPGPRPPSLWPSHPVPGNDSQILNRPHPASREIWFPYWPVTRLRSSDRPFAQPVHRKFTDGERSGCHPFWGHRRAACRRWLCFSPVRHQQPSQFRALPKLS